MSGKSAGQKNRSNGHEVKEYNGPSAVQVKKKSLNWNPMLSTTILAQSLCLAGTIWLDPLTVTCMCIICRGHTLCSGSCKLQGGEGKNSRAQDDSTLWVETLVLQAALQHSVIIILSVQSNWGQKMSEERGREERGWGGWQFMQGHGDIYSCFWKEKDGTGDNRQQRRQHFYV